MTSLDVDRHLDVRGDIIEDIKKRGLSPCYAKPKLKELCLSVSWNSTDQ
jgi:hypothetical protein